jgi:protein kinase C substrate 80K-H
VFDLVSYLPDSFIPKYEDFKDSLVGLLQAIGIVKADEESASIESSRAQQAFNDAENALKRLQDEQEKSKNDLKEIFNIHGFGAEGEWKKLDGQCLEKEQGE